MSGTGRGRGEPKIPKLAERSGELPVLDVERTSSSSSSDGDGVVRGRGGFRRELRTIPKGITDVKAPQNAQGQMVELYANFIPVGKLGGGEVYKYRIDFEPDVEIEPLRRRLFNAMTRDVFSRRVIFDGISDARSTHKTEQEVSEFETPNPLRDNEIIKMKMKRTGSVNWEPAETLRLYNMNMKAFLRALGYYMISRDGAYVHPNNATQVGNNTGIMMVRGFRTSANVHQNDRILMNLEPVHKLMQAKNVLATLTDIKNKKPNNLQQACKSALTGKLVVAVYSKAVYRVEDVDFTKNPLSTFFDSRRNQNTSYTDYFRDRYQKNIVDQRQPLLLVVPNNRQRNEGGDQPEIFLIPELCNIAGLTEEQRDNMGLKRDLISSSQVAPAQRVAHMQSFLQQLHSNDEVREILNRWEYSLGNEPVKLKGRTVPTEVIGVGRQATQNPSTWPKIDPTGSFEKEVLRESLARAPELKKLHIIVGRNDIGTEPEISRKLSEGFRRVGLDPRNVEITKMNEGDSSNLYVNAINRLAPDTSATLVIMTRQNKDRYDAIKKAASVERGLISQVVTAKLMTDPRKAAGAAVKIAIQVAAKLGGEPWHVALPLQGVMICGYDTHHDTARRGRSFGAFIASTNAKFSNWFSKADSHDRLDELSSHMAENVAAAMRKYHEKNKAYPERVFIYRDGVGDGQLEHVFKTEMKQVKKALQEVSKNTRMTFTVVNKRIGARFYMKAGNTFANPPPGTVIDDVVTREFRYDFYLISQSTRNGTVNPTYYNILHDESGLDAGRHQMMAYKMCLLYYNWAGTVRVPAPCQYAHKLAFLCGEHLHAVPNACLDDRLHFL